MYGREGTLWTVPFDSAQLEVTGEPLPVLEEVMTKPATGTFFFSLSREGSLVYVPEGGKAGKPIWVDRNGQETEWSTGEKDRYIFPRLSPTDQKVAACSADMNIWVLEVGQKRKTLLTHEGLNLHPRWTPDGERITFVSTSLLPLAKRTRHSCG